MKRALLLGVLACGTHTAMRELVDEAPEPSWETDEAEALARARREGKGVLVNVFASWSVPDVHQAEHLDDPRVARAIEPAFVRWRLDVSNGATPELERRYQTTVTPQVILIDPDGRITHRTRGVVLPDDLVRLVEDAR